jgi:hypothetical protein
MAIVSGYSSANLAALATTTLWIPNPSGQSYAMLHTISINTKGSASNTCTVYDSATAAGTIIATIDTTSQVQTLFYDALIQQGLTVVLATGGSANITVTWKKLAGAND